MTEALPTPPGDSRTTAPRILAAAAPLFLNARPWPDYCLLDMGNGRKLERYGARTIVRPEPQAMGSQKLPVDQWFSADATFTADGDEDGAGRWKKSGALSEFWPLSYRDVRFFGRFTAFRHVGLFPEQVAHWDFMRAEIETAGRPFRLLNLFAYTGVASLIAAAAGAEVTHVDASKKAIGWARENQALSKMEKLPIRWICDDAVKFVEREGRRGRTYDGILLDPPKFGRGPKGEVWNLFEALPGMIDACATILSPNARFLVLTAYAIRASFAAFDVLMRERLVERGGMVRSGELLLPTHEGERQLSTSLFSRWTPEA
ncbi:MAG: class I SAM-dependent methyltransferase [Pseudomonadota bacterium]